MDVFSSLSKHNFIKIREDEITSLTQDAFLKTIRDRFDVLYGCLNNDDAFVVNDENLNCPYISIGETYIVSDWMEGKEIMYSCVFCIFIALIIIAIIIIVIVATIVIRIEYVLVVPFL